ncbi:hypothetical protein LTR17_015350 [Elasticomyces elasticus]|nr:hypothetical protein LTR17_015350 [Elasticomyces elasticus]
MGEIENLAEVYGGPHKCRPSLFLQIEEGLKINPHGKAVVVAHQASTHLAELVKVQDAAGQPGPDHGSDCLSWTFTQLHVAAMGVVKGMVASGVKPGSTIVTLIPNGVESLLLLWVSTIMRFTLAPLDVGALTEARHEELLALLQTLKPDVVVVQSLDDAKKMELLLRESGIPLPQLRFQLDSGVSTQNGWQSKWRTLTSLVEEGFEYDIDQQSLLDRARSYEPDRIALIMFTSGTSSGKPKGCPRHVGSIAQAMEIQVWGPKYGVGTNMLFSTANFRIIAPFTAMALWRVGGTLVMPGAAFTPEAVLDTIEKHSITNMLLLPFQVHSIVAHPTFSTRDTSSIQTVFTGADMITKDLLVKMTIAFPTAVVCTGHGMTEGGAFCEWVWFDTPPAQIPYFGEISPLGKISAGSRVRIWDQEAGSVARRGAPGELHVCNNVTIRHYLGNINEDSFYSDDLGRWFKTGDLGMIDGDGIIYVLGRIKDVVMRAGVPITPAALESTIGVLTGVLVSVIAIPSSTLGQEPFAVLQSFNGRSEAEIKQCIIDVFGKDYQLAGAVSLKQLGLDAFPLTTTSKVIKFELQKAVQVYLDRQ